MADLTLLILAFIITMVAIHMYRRDRMQDVTGPKQTQRITRLWEYFDTASKRGNWDAAERALLQILKYDHKNTAAYNQLGMIYVRTKRFEDAIACFDIASSLAPSVASLYNLGLVHFQTGNFQEAASALEKVVDLEPTPKRLLVFARILQYLEEDKKVIDVLRRVVDMDPSERNLTYLAEGYEAAKQYKKAEEIWQQIHQIRQTEPQQFHPGQVNTS